MSLRPEIFGLRRGLFGLGVFCSNRFPQAFHSRPACPKHCKPLRKDPLSSQKAQFSSKGFEVTLTETVCPTSNRSRPAQDANREEKDCSQEGQDTFHSDPDDAEWQEDEPNKRIRDKREQRERPAEEKQDAPQDESGHEDLLATYYARARLEVPSTAKALSLSLRAIETGTSAFSSI